MDIEAAVLDALRGRRPRAVPAWRWRLASMATWRIPALGTAKTTSSAPSSARREARGGAQQLEKITSSLLSEIIITISLNCMTKYI